MSYKLPKLRPFCTSTKIKFLYDIEDEEFYFLISLWMQKYVKKEKRYRLINSICLLAVYKKLIGTGRVLGTRILRYGNLTKKKKCRTFRDGL